MGKIGGGSWLNAVKKAFGSPSKDKCKSNNSRSRDEHEQDPEEKKRGKRRWIFKKPLLHETTTIQHNAAINTTSINPLARGSPIQNSDKICEIAANNTTTHPAAAINPSGKGSPERNSEKRYTIAVAIASKTTAEAAAAAAAQAAVEVMRLAKPPILARKHYAAVIIQTAFRGYLARRAHKALKGLVKIQALVRGYTVRKRAKMTLQCMQALVRVQDRVRDQRKRLSLDTSSADSKCTPRGFHYADQNSASRDENESTVTEEWDSHIHRLEEIQAILQKTKEVAQMHERDLTRAFSHQMWTCDKDQFLSKDDVQENSRWSTKRTWERTKRSSCDQKDPRKTLEINTARFNSYSTPSPSRIKPVQVHSASPRCQREERNYLMAQTPTLCSIYSYGNGTTGNESGAQTPNYMAATASANARIRSQSAPRNRHFTPEREKKGSAKKRLSFLIAEAYNDTCFSESEVDHNLRRSSYTTINGSHYSVDRRLSTSSCCKDGIEDESSRPSTSDTRKWLR